MTRRAGQPPEDDLFRTSFALHQSWATRLKALLTRRSISLPEQLRRWIAMDEWVTAHTADDSPNRLYIHHADGTVEAVKLVAW